MTAKIVVDSPDTWVARMQRAWAECIEDCLASHGVTIENHSQRVVVYRTVGKATEELFVDGCHVATVTLDLLSPEGPVVLTETPEGLEKKLSSHTSKIENETRKLRGCCRSLRASL